MEIASNVARIDHVQSSLVTWNANGFQGLVSMVAMSCFVLCMTNSSNPELVHHSFRAVIVSE